MDRKTRIQITNHYGSIYKKATKKGKQTILDVVVDLTGYNRKYALELLGKPRIKVRRKKITRSRTSRYKPVMGIIEKLWKYGRYPCSARLKVMMPIYIDSLERHQELSVTTEEKILINQISERTLDRQLKFERHKLKLKIKRGGTKPGTLLKNQIPIKMWTDWDHTKPGFLEIDSVHHGGGDPSGHYCYTVSLEDVSTGWHENQAHLGKSEAFTTTAINSGSKRFPFPVLGLDFDTGGEFVNWHLKRYCDRKKITYTRARVGMKNDQCYVEQSNWSQVREYVGYARFDTKQQCDFLNQLYVVMSDYLNYFQAKQRCIKKIRNGAKVKRKFETKTPYQRVLESKEISQKNKDKLTKHFHTLNPKKLLIKILKLQKLLELSVRN